MDKAILVIDMPENCFDCPLCINDEYGLSLECCLQYKGYVDKKGKPNWCQLKKAPEKYDLVNVLYTRDWDGEYENGYNACVDEILGN